MEETSAAQGMTRTDSVYILENLGGTSKEATPKPPIIETDAHKNALMKVLSEAYVPANITSGEMDNMVGHVLESHKITFHEDELPPEGLSHNRALHITVQLEDKFIARVLINGGSSLNICPLTTPKRLGKGLHEIRMGSMNVKAFDGSQRATIREINLDLQMGLNWFDVEFQVLDIYATYNLLLGRSWIHAAGAVASTLYQAVKFEWNHQEVIIHGDRNNPIYTNQTVPVIENRRKLGRETYHHIEWVKTIEKDRWNIDSEDLEDDIIPEEIVKEVENLENKPKSNLEETETVNLWDSETVKETRVSIHLSPSEKEEYIIFLKEYEDIFAWSYDGCHQIWMDEEDAEKTAFITPWGIYCYKMMFGLKNVGATYTRAMMTIFHDMIQKKIEVYVDDVIIKSKRSSDHIADLKKVFDRLRKYNLKLNPTKCAFGVLAGKLLGLNVSR
ncbi:uncharacterized protein [Nicotiana tomentosiformis]|uniref:uncharacterized protein n=1 Tax=Nicotiana tomentosiformis TaxID=4098 RepID=UPI00388CC80D